MQPLNQEAEVQKRVDKARKRRDEFIARVKREEIRANANPKQYRKRVALLAALGYSYIFGTLAILLVFLVGLIYVMFVTQSANILGGKLLIIIVFTIIAILRSMYIKFDKVGGLKLTRSEAPQLYAEVDSIADRLKAPRIDEIRINEELNAAAIQRPRLGIFGWYENTLLLGLPLLLSLEPDEARAVIAHEFGHFSGAHGKFSARIYRLNRTWEALRQNLARQKKEAGSLSSSSIGFNPASPPPRSLSAEPTNTKLTKPPPVSTGPTPSPEDYFACPPLAAISRRPSGAPTTTRSKYSPTRRARRSPPCPPPQPPPRTPTSSKS